jgi:two-component system, OmpR family, osmolarity sensor histidine kinase EnvZ
VTRAPRSLFARTAVLIACTLLAFSVIAWQAIIWTTLVPSAELASGMLSQRAAQAVTAGRDGRPLPDGARFENTAPVTVTPRFVSLAARTYMEAVRGRLLAGTGALEARVHRFTAPPEIWLRMREFPNQWLVLSWRIVGPRAPLAALGVLGVAALLTLGAAAFSARRLTAPLAELAAAAARVAEGERVAIRETTGPREVRALASAFQSMSHRLAELDEQRELMLAGISHDLRTPLARLRVAVELLGSPDAALTAEMVANIEEVDRMIGQFLHYVRSDYREAPAHASLDEIVRQALGPLGSDERVRFEPGAAEPRAFAVESARHALLNLLQNALEYGRPPVTVRTALTARGIQIVVHDRGAGLDPAEWSQALRPFHRLRDQPGDGHTGLGLAMVERLIRVAGGELTAARAPDGFAVRVSLPASPPSELPLRG